MEQGDGEASRYGFTIERQRNIITININHITFKQTTIRPNINNRYSGVGG